MAGTHSKLSKIEIKTGSNTWVKINGTTEISGIGGGAPTISDISDLDSTAKEKLIGLTDEGQATINCNYLPADTGQLAVEAARGTGALTQFRATYSTGVGSPVYAFSAYVLTFETSVGVDKQLTLSSKFEISGSVTKTVSA